MAGRTHTIVATDANILINFIHIGQLDLLGSLPDMTFMVPSEVTNEITDKIQVTTLHEAFKADRLQEAAISGIDELEHYATLIRTLGKGESACLALAKSRGWSLASDEKRAFRRTALQEIGEDRILTTPEIIVDAIHAGLASVNDADRWKQSLAEHQFSMKFESFQEIL